MTPAEALAALTTLRADGYTPRLVPLPPDRWRVEIRQPGHDWTALHPAHPGFVTIEEAVEQAVARVAGLQTARREAIDAEVAGFVRSRRLKDTTVDVDGQPQPRWLAQREDGTWTEPEASPEAAVQAARQAAPAGPAQGGGAGGVRTR